MRFFRHASPPGRLGAACGEAGCLRHNRHVAWLLPCPSVTFHTADNVSLIRPTRADPIFSAVHIFLALRRLSDALNRVVDRKLELLSETLRMSLVDHPIE